MRTFSLIRRSLMTPMHSSLRCLNSTPAFDRRRKGLWVSRLYAPWALVESERWASQTWFLEKRDELLRRLWSCMLRNRNRNRL